MGGPGVTAYSCVQYISDATNTVRELKNAATAIGSEELRSKFIDLQDHLAEAKLAGIEAIEEIDSLVAHLEQHDREIESRREAHAKASIPPVPLFGQKALGWMTHAHASSQVALHASATQAPDPAPSDTETRQAANLIRLASFAAADQGFRSLDTFASWFVGGTAAAVGLMIANFEKIEPFVNSLDLQRALVMVVAALGLVGIAKFFGSLVCTLARGTERVLAVLDQWEKRGWPIPSAEALQAAREATLPAPFKWIPKKFRQRSDDPLVQARQIMRFLFIAGISTLTAVVFVILVLVDIAMAL